MYFLSSMPCALRLGGVFFGAVDSFERFAEVSLKDNLFVEFIPENALPVCFFLNDQIRFTPPVGCEVYILRDGIAVYAKDFPPSDLAFSLIAQRREGKTLATVFKQGRIYFSVQSESGVTTDILPRDFAECELSFSDGCWLLKSPRSLAVYSLQGERLLLENVLSYSVEQGLLRARLPLSDSQRRVADCAWELSDEGCKRTEFTLKQYAEGENSGVPEDLIPYAFFESVLIGANYADLLSEALQSKTDLLVDFLKDFTDVILTDDPSTCGLIRKKAEGLFEAAYYTVKMEKGKIIDITT